MRTRLSTEQDYALAYLECADGWCRGRHGGRKRGMSPLYLSLFLTLAISFQTALFGREQPLTDEEAASASEMVHMLTPASETQMALEKISYGERMKLRSQYACMQLAVLTLVWLIVSFLLDQSFAIPLPVAAATNNSMVTNLMDEPA